MDKKEIIILSAIVVFACVRLYMRYGKKTNPGVKTKNNTDTMDYGNDDYEPYSGK